MYNLREHFFTKDGQGKLETYDKREWLDTESPQNENGQLFATMYYFAFDRLNLLEPMDKIRWIHMVELCRGFFKGIFYRRKQDVNRSQSHDNLVGIAAGSLLFETEHAKELSDYLHSHFGMWHKTLVQGGDIAVVDMCAGLKPKLWLMLWLLGGLYFTKKDAGQLNLARLRIWALDKASKKYGFYKLPYEKWFNIMYPNNHTSTEEYFGRPNERNPYIDLMVECAKLKI